jgi:hypothetical protein
MLFAGGLAATALTAAAQTTSPSRQPPPQEQPTLQQQPQVRLPQGATPQLQPLSASIPVFIVWGDGRLTGPLSQMPGEPTPRVIRYGPNEHDHDGDGMDARQFGGGDCDDGDPARAADQAEVIDAAGVDEDCDPRTVGAQRGDRDGDGFITWRAMNIIRDASGRALAVIRGPDCDDDRADTHPGSVEVLGDLRDNDCDGEIDVIRPTGHGNYCPPTEQVSATRADNPCGPLRGDTSQFQRR